MVMNVELTEALRKKKCARSFTDSRAFWRCDQSNIVDYSSHGFWATLYFVIRHLYHAKIAEHLLARWVIWTDVITPQLTFTDRVSTGGNAIACVRLSVCPSVRFHRYFWTASSMTLTFCMCMGHDHNSPGIEGQGQRSTPNSTEIGPALLEISWFFYFQGGGHRYLRFWKSWNFIGWRNPEGRDTSSCQISSKLVNPLRHHYSTDLFATLDVLDEYFVVFIITRNLDTIDVVISIIRKFTYLAHLVWKHLFTPILFFGNLTPKSRAISMNTQKAAVPEWGRIVWAIERENPSSGLTYRSV